MSALLGISLPFPCLRDLPEAERAPFAKELEHQTRPLVDGVPREDQDFFYQCDYDNWKSGSPSFD